MPDTHSNNATIVGVDVAKSKLDLYFCSTGEHRTVDNEKKAIQKLIQQLNKLTSNPMIVMENTGGYEILAQQLFVKAGYPVHIAHPSRIHHFAKQKGYFAKTDKLDAKIIGEYAMQEEVIPNGDIPNEQSELKALASRRTQLIDQLTAEKCRLKEHLPAQIKRSIKRSIKNIEREIALIDAEIDKLVASSQELTDKSNRLITFKGVGKKTARQLICLLPELGQISRNEIACLTGLAPKNRDSGSKTGRRMISGGRFYARKALYMAALSAIKSNEKMREHYNHLKNKGKHSKIAVTAVMRKIIVTLNAMLRDNNDWGCYSSAVCDKG